MAVHGGPKIATSGLVLSLDVANSKSYPDAVNYYSTPETLTDGRVGSTSGGNYTDFTSGGPDGGRFTRWTNDTGTSGSTAWHWGIDYSNTGLSTGQPVIISFYARCPNATVSNITLNSPDSVIVNATLDSTWRLFVGTALYGGDYVSTPFVRINRSNTSTFANGATYDIALFKIQKGNIWTDISGRGNTGTLTNGPTYSSANGGSIVFDGVDDYVNLPYTLLSGTGNFTVSIWLKCSASTVGGNLFGNYPAGNLEVFYGSRYIGMWLNNASTYLGTSPWSTTLPEFTTNYTQIVALRKNTSDTEFYINGVLVKTGSSSDTIGSVNNFRIGTNTSGTETFTGSIPQVSIYNRALTAAEIQQNYNATRGRFGI